MKEGGFAWRFNVPVLHATLQDVVGHIELGLNTLPALFIRGSESDYVSDDDLDLLEDHFLHMDHHTIQGRGTGFTPRRQTNSSTSLPTSWRSPVLSRKPFAPGHESPSGLGAFATFFLFFLRKLHEFMTGFAARPRGLLLARLALNHQDVARGIGAVDVGVA